MIQFAMAAAKPWVDALPSKPPTSVSDRSSQPAEHASIPGWRCSLVRGTHAAQITESAVSAGTRTERRKSGVGSGRFRTTVPAAEQLQILSVRPSVPPTDNDF
jgi:hypothetical protein